jgi:hypothetical protein
MQQIEFQLNCEYVELNQLLKMVGLCDSGGQGAGGRGRGLSMFSWSCARLPRYVPGLW